MRKLCGKILPFYGAQGTRFKLGEVVYSWSPADGLVTTEDCGTFPSEPIATVEVREFDSQFNNYRDGFGLRDTQPLPGIMGEMGDRHNWLEYGYENTEEGYQPFFEYDPNKPPRYNKLKESEMTEIQTSLKVSFIEEASFTTFQEAFDHISTRNYESVSVVAGQVRLEADGLIFNDTKYELWDVFIDAVYGLTKLPRRNEEILPIENLLRDVNTLLDRMQDDELLVKLMNGKVYSMYRAGKKGVRQPLTHVEFMEILRDNIDLSQVKRVDLSKKLLRVVSYDENNPVEVLPNDVYYFGTDIVNGDTFKSYPLTFAQAVYRRENEGVAVMPHKDKIYKYKASEKLEVLKKRFIKTIATTQIDEELTTKRLTRIGKLKLDIEILRFLFAGTNGMPVAARESVFSPFFIRDDNGKLTKLPKDGTLEGVTIADIYERITFQCHNNPDFSLDNRYKIEMFAGSLLDEGNKKLGALTWKDYDEEDQDIFVKIQSTEVPNEDIDGMVANPE